MTRGERESKIADLKKRQEFFYDKDIALLIELLEQEPKSKCNYCHTDSDECIEPLDKNAHIYLYPISGVRLKGEHMEVAYREYAINYCPICGRKLSETPTNTESEVDE